MSEIEQRDSSILDSPTTYFFVSEYEVDQGYGGPEEGGWWYDVYTFERVHRVFEDEDEAYEFARTLNREQRQRDEDERKRPRWSVIGDPDTAFLVEDLPGERTTTHRPHYE